MQACFPLLAHPTSVILLHAALWNPFQLSQQLRVLTEGVMEKIAEEEQLWVFKHSFHLFWMPTAKAPWFFGSSQPEHVFFNLFHDVIWHINGRQHTHTHQAAWGYLITTVSIKKNAQNLSIFFNWTQDLLGHTLKTYIWAWGLDLWDDELSLRAVNETKEMTPWIRSRNCFNRCPAEVDAGILSTEDVDMSQPAMFAWVSL